MTTQATQAQSTTASKLSNVYDVVDEFIRGAYILAVDDFSAIRRIVINTLRAKEAFVDEASNGLMALDKLKLAYENNVPYDMVFLDIEMPVMDGLDFLRYLRKEPGINETPVVIVSSHSERGEITECINYGIADYIIKPITKERIYNAVYKALSKSGRRAPKHEEAQSLEAGAVPDVKLYAKTIFRKLESIDNLPALPTVLERIKELTHDPNSNNERIAAIMQDEPSMMANVLKLANSVLYGARERIDNLQNAITRLGLTTVCNLATQMGVLNVYSQMQVEGFNHKEFCRHSICVGIAMQVINDMCREKIQGRYSKDLLHLAGLLHDVGKIVILQFFREEYQRALKLGQTQSMSLFASEQKIMGLDHSEVGAWLGKKWSLAESQLSVIAFHHAPLIAEADNSELVGLCHAANYICNVQHIGDAGDLTAPIFDQRVFDQFGLEVSAIPDVIRRVVQESKQSEVLMSFLK